MVASCRQCRHRRHHRHHRLRCFCYCFILSSSADLVSSVSLTLFLSPSRYFPIVSFRFIVLRTFDSFCLCFHLFMTSFYFIRMCCSRIRACVVSSIVRDYINCLAKLSARAPIIINSAIIQIDNACVDEYEYILCTSIESRANVFNLRCTTK